MRKILPLLVLVLGLFACGSHEPFDVGGEESDTAASADSTSNRDTSADTTPPAPTCQGKCGTAYNDKAQCQCDAECVVNKDCCGDYQKFCTTAPPANCVDSDGDGFCSTSPKAGDCNDNNKLINPDMPEKCGDSVDNNCNGYVDEGCAAQCVPTNEVCGDNKDNDCDGQVDEGCVVPCVATTEVCADGKDNDCDGQVDEGCAAPTGNNTLTVKYSDSASRRLSYGVTSDVSSIPYVWTTGSWQTSDTFTVDLGNLQVPSSKCLYVRFNVDEPNSKWLCMANQLNAAATMTLNAFSKTYGTSSVQKISLGGGCSAIYAVAFDGASCPIP